MGLIDFILNVAGLLLWLNWRSLGISSRGRSPGVSLLATLQRAERPGTRRWVSLAGLLALLLVRSVVYWQLGPTEPWSPSLNLGAISLTFRSDYAGRMLVYSLLSFGQLLLTFYLWLLLLAMVNRSVSDSDPIQRQIRLHLGPLASWPATLQVLVPFVGAVLLWAVSNPVLVRLGITPHPQYTGHLWQQALVLASGVYLAWEFLLVGLLFLHLINSYVYLGNWAFWNFINATARNLLVPLRLLPLQLGRFDGAPLCGMALVLLTSEFGAQGLALLYQRLPL